VENIASRRSELADIIAARLQRDLDSASSAFASSAPVRHFVVDGLLGSERAAHIGDGFPATRSLIQRSTLRERKRTGIKLHAYDPIIGDALFAFQAPVVVDSIRRITGYRSCSADPTLYASGISVMGRGDFLNPHLDNSHDGDRKRYRVLNLLYYVSPEWHLAKGGNLEIWDRSVERPTVIEARFDRLVVMETCASSWHSVNEILVHEPRRCVSNYYFSDDPPGGKKYQHVTTFTGRPEQPLRRAFLRVSDGIVLNAIGRALPFATRLTRHRLKTRR